MLSLAGRTVLDEEGYSSALTIYGLADRNGNPLANGVYLYVVTVRGWDGRVLRSEVRKLVILR